MNCGIYLLRAVQPVLWVVLVLHPMFAAEPFFAAENLFPPGNKHAHSSSIVECPDGSLLTCWFYGSGERRANDVQVQGARWNPGSKTWGSVFVMADTPEFPDCNPVLFVDRRERVWMLWICVLAERWECSQLKYRRAETLSPAGAPNWSWQDVIQLKPGPQFGETMAKRFGELNMDSPMWAEYAKPYHRMLLEATQDPYKRQTGWMTRTHPITLPSGRILLPLYSDGFNASLMAISDDDGQTWRASSPIIGLGPIQPSVVRRKDGSLVAFCRDSGDRPPRVMVATSQDRGESWSAAVDSEIPNPGSSLEVIALADGRWLMVCNDTETGRNRLSALLSEDEGRSWTNRRVIEPRHGKGRGFDYPSVIQTRDGLIHLTYSHTSSAGRSIRHCVMNSQWIESGDESK